jgi:hypothetical protein
MNERPSTGIFREGFINERAESDGDARAFHTGNGGVPGQDARPTFAPPPAPAPAPAPEGRSIPPQDKTPEQQVAAAMPPPELEPSPADTEAVQIDQDTWPIVVRLLYKPLVIPGTNQTYTEIAFREPRGGDINRYGNPCRINGEGEVLIEERKMHYIMAALSGILPPYLELLDPRDWNSCAYRLRHFFAPDPRAWLSVQTRK